MTLTQMLRENSLKILWFTGTENFDKIRKNDENPSNSTCIDLRLDYLIFMRWVPLFWKQTSQKRKQKLLITQIIEISLVTNLDIKL